jgi:hypothetical protein
LSPFADDYRIEQSQLLAHGMPTSFLVQFGTNNLEQGLAAAIRDFQEVPAKYPQKNLIKSSL